VERAGRQDGADRHEQLVVGESCLRAALPTGRRRHRDPTSVDARARRAQRRADERQRI